MLSLLPAGIAAGVMAPSACDCGGENGWVAIGPGT
jgi:hypothetical protein